MKRIFNFDFITRMFNNRYIDRLRGICKHWPEIFISIISTVRFLRLRVERKTVLIVEPNIFHAEVLPGFCKYFMDMGYEVILICRYVNVKEKVFCRFKKKPAIYVFDPKLMMRILKSRKVQEIEIAFFTSRQIFGDDIHVWGDYLNFLGNSFKPRYGSFCVEHHYIHNEYSYSMNIKNTFFLSRNTFKGEQVPMINPHYFGQVSHTPLNSGKRIFIFVGKISLKIPNIKSLIDVLKKLEKKYEFEVWLVGKNEDYVIADSIPDSIRFLGRLTYDMMFQHIEKADFFLVLLDPEIDDQKKYLRGVTSGSRQLILGFCKVALIHTDFAKVYDFSQNNSIIYGNKDFAKAMEYALTISEEEYADLQHGLKNLSKKVFNESYENLRDRIEERYSGRDEDRYESSENNSIFNHSSRL